MTSKKSAASLLLLAVIAASSVGGFLIGQQSSVTPPDSHALIVKRTAIMDTSTEHNGYYLIPKCVDAGARIYGKFSITTLEIFIANREYEQSTWLWQRNGDTEVAMTIWGPGEDGITVMLEFAKLGADPFIVQITGTTVITMPKSTASPAEGYYVLSAQITP